MFDFQCTLRALIRNLGVTTIVVGTLAITIGISTSVFSVVYGVLLKPLPYEEPDRLAVVTNADRPTKDAINVDAFREFRARNRTFESVSLIATMSPIPASLSDHYLVRVSPGFFDQVLRVRLTLGRTFSNEDEQPDAPPVVIISHALWRSEFGSDPDVIGRTLQHQEYAALEVVGVLPPDFRSPENLDHAPHYWTPINVSSPIPANRMFDVIGRLKPEITIEEASVELETIRDVLIAAGQSPMQGRNLEVVPLESYYVTDRRRTTILMFFGIVIAVFLIGVANLVGLELSHLPRRKRELSVRAALGATNWHLVRYSLVRALTVSIAGAALGVLLMLVSHRFLTASLASDFPRTLDIGINWNVFMFAIGLSLVATLLIAIVPAVCASRPDLREALQEASRSYTSDRRYRLLLDGVTTLQTAAAVALVLVAGLLVHSFWQLTTVDMGIDPDGVIIARIRLPAEYSPPRRENVFDELVSRLDAVSDRVALSESLPGFLLSRGIYRAPNSIALPPNLPSRAPYEELSDEGYRLFDHNAVSEDYFEVLGIPVLRGRLFSAAERRAAAKVMLVSESVANSLWPGRNPIGYQVDTYLDSGEVLSLAVVGVVGDIRRQIRDEETALTAYVPSGHIFRTRDSGRLGHVILKGSTPNHEIERMIGEIDPNATAEVLRMQDRFSGQVSVERFRGVVLGVLSSIALLMTAIGIYSVVAHSVLYRTAELGVRMALGARRSSLVLGTVCRGVLPAGLGMLVGVTVVYGFSDVLGAYLFAIQPTDHFTYLAAIVIAGLVIVAAAAVPSRYVAKLDPMDALRYE